MSLYRCLFHVLLCLAFCCGTEKSINAMVRVTVRPAQTAANEKVENNNKPETEKETKEKETVVSSKAPTAENLIIGRKLADYRTENDGFIAIEDQMGRYRLIKTVDIVSVTEDETPFEPYDRKNVMAELKKEYGDNFEILTTEHFYLVYNTSEGYATWCGKLFETLFDAFERYRSQKGFKLSAPDVPLIVVIFSGKKEFLEHVSEDAPGVTNIVAYYHRMTNRTVLYDLSEMESLIPKEKRRSRTYKQVDEILSRPQAAFNVATIVHEATHQIAFNRKMLLRSGPFPLWLAEGISMYFETPDTNSARGWSGRGLSNRPNRYRLQIMNQKLLSMPRKPIQNLIGEENYMHDVQLSYALSWGLYYYLSEKAPKKLVKYVEFLQSKLPFTVYSPTDRIADYEMFFGNDWDQFNRNFNRFYKSIR